MDAEEYEQIPWANLVADAQPSIDKRVYIAGGILAAIVVLFIGARAFGGGTVIQAAPAPEPVAVADATPFDLGPDSPFAPPPLAPIVSVSEADLMAGVGEPSGDFTAAANAIPRLKAEWFVTDFFTRDGSPETLASLELALATGEVAAELPHHEHDGFGVFVEWAKTFEVVDHGSWVEVSVAYRTVHEEGGGFVRDPVRAVSVALTVGPDGWLVDALPLEIDLP